MYEKYAKSEFYLAEDNFNIFMNLCNLKFKKQLR